MAVSDRILLEEGRRVIQIEKDALQLLQDNLGQSFLDAVFLILNTQGNVIFSGVGKSGHVGRKLAATFSSTGTTSYFVHADEAAHGDLGMIREKDAFIAISFSGESDELLALVPALKAMRIPIISITGRPNSSLAQLATVSLVTPVEKEACPLNLAPTASTTVTMALGDAIAGALMVARGFRAEDFARSHPAGALGRRLLLKVKDVMRVDDALPVVTTDDSATDALRKMADKHLGLFVVVDSEGIPFGLFTEGDLCRRIQSGVDFRELKAEEIVNISPICISPDESAYMALKLINEHQINQVLVIDPDNRKLVGIVHIQDLIAKKIK